MSNPLKRESSILFGTFTTMRIILQERLAPDPFRFNSTDLRYTRLLNWPQVFCLFPKHTNCYSEYPFTRRNTFAAVLHDFFYITQYLTILMRLYVRFEHILVLIGCPGFFLQQCGLVVFFFLSFLV